MKPTLHSPSLALLVISAGIAHGQSTISSSDKYAYAANAGWVNFRPTSPDGVIVTETYLSGYAYSANFGWIHFGDGSPDNGHSYSNSSNTDYGVNMDSSGQLTGYAYAANVGWINFEQSQGQAGLDFLSGQFTGYAYGANVGWIALDTTSSDLLTATLACPDSDSDGIGDAYERFHFNGLSAINAISDYDGDGQTDVQEYIAGTDPDDPGSWLRITDYSLTLGASPSAQLTFTSTPGRVYSIEHDTDLQAAWTGSSLGTFSPDAGTTTGKTIPIPNPAGPRRFFRVLAHKPLQP